MPEEFLASSSLWMPLLMVALFCFLFIFPQRKQRKAHMEMINSLKEGDRVVTIGGLHGVISSLQEETVSLKTDNNVNLVFERSAVRVVRDDSDKNS